MRIIPITDADDPRLDDFRNLTDADVRPGRRGIVIAEGVNVVQRLAASPYRVRAVVGVPSRPPGPSRGATRSPWWAASATTALQVSCSTPCGPPAWT